jgi:uncharacterized membrane protein
MRVSHGIEIFAPPQSVWNATVDVENWPQWTPTVESIRRVTPGALIPGSEVLIKQPNLPETSWRVSQVQPEECFRWHARIRAIPAVATHRIEKKQDRVVNHLGFEMSGFLAVLIWPFIRGQIARTLEIENQGLKRYCEAGAS